MRRTPFSLYLMPPRPGSGPRARAYISAWKMSPAQAAGVGALYPVPGSTEFRDVPESEEEKAAAMANYQSAGRDGAKPPAGGS